MILRAMAAASINGLIMKHKIHIKDTTGWILQGRIYTNHSGLQLGWASMFPLIPVYA